MAATEKTIRKYTLGEEIFNAVSHGVGAGLSVAALVTLIVHAAHVSDAYGIVSVSLYGATLVILYTMSTLYHALTPAGAKRVFRVFDHTTIFLLIAGTYTPYLLVTLRGALGWTLFGILWGLAVIGIVFDAVMLDRFRKIELLLYVCMGWCIVLTAKPLIAALEKPGLILLLVGGVCYTVGILFYKLKKIPYMHSIWHLFVLAGSILHYFSIYLYVL